MDQKTAEMIRVIRHNWREEMVVARTYRLLAQRERNRQNCSMLSLMAVSEEEHAGLWAERLQALGEKVDPTEINEAFAAQVRAIDARGVHATIREIEREERRHVGDYQAQILALNDPASTEILKRVVPDEEHHSERLREMIKEFSVGAHGADSVRRVPWIGRLLVDVPEARATFVSMVGLIGAWTLSGIPQLISLTISLIAGGGPALKETIEKLRSRTIDIDMLMIIAAIGAIFIGSPTEGALLLFLFSLSGTLESFTLGHTRDAIAKLMSLRPAEARRAASADSTEELLPIEEFNPGELIVVHPGESIPLDGTIRSGTASVDQSAITGESQPVNVGPGTCLMTGVLNLDGILTLEVTSRSGDSALCKIIQLMSEAQEERSLASSQRFAERVGRYYTPFVLVGCLAWFGVLWFGGLGYQQALYQAIGLLIAASPCALILSAPAPILSALAGAARRGILIRNGNALETLARVSVVAFDKTGTLTTGLPHVIEHAAQGIDEYGALQLLGSLESASPHPLARGIVRAAQDKNIPLQTPTNFENIPGKGVTGVVTGKSGRAGQPEWISPTAVRLAAPLKAQGLSVVAAEFGDATMVFGLRDSVRTEAAPALAALREAGVRLLLLSGDHELSVQQVATELKISEVRSEQRPEHKVAALKELSERGTTVAMVGDGINDAPALQAASVGFTLGGIGSDVALESADIVVMDDSLTAVPTAIVLGQRAMRIAQQNLWLALGSVILLVGSVVSVGLSLPIAVIGHEGTTVLVILNGLRLLRQPRTTPVA